MHGASNKSRWKICVEHRPIHIEINVWSTAHWLKESFGFDADVRIEQKYRSVGYGNQCALVW